MTLALDATVQAAASNDHAAFEVLFSRFEPLILKLCTRVMGDPDVGREMAQDAFLKAWIALTTGRYVAGGFSSWLHRIALNCCRDELRHQSLIEWHSLDAFIGPWHLAEVDTYPGVDPERTALRSENSSEVRRVLAELSLACRVPLLLFEFRDLSHKEMAEALTITRSAAKSRLHRAHISFREHAERLERRGTIALSRPSIEAAAVR